MVVVPSLATSEAEMAGLEGDLQSLGVKLGYTLWKMMKHQILGYLIFKQIQVDIRVQNDLGNEGQYSRIT